MSTETFTECSSIGTMVTLYANWLEIQLPGGTSGKKETIHYSNILSAERSTLSHCIDIKTDNGKSHRISLLTSAEAATLQNHLKSLL